MDMRCQEDRQIFPLIDRRDFQSLMLEGSSSFLHHVFLFIF